MKSLAPVALLGLAAVLLVRPQSVQAVQGSGAETPTGGILGRKFQPVDTAGLDPGLTGFTDNAAFNAPAGGGLSGLVSKGFDLVKGIGTKAGNLLGFGGSLPLNSATNNFGFAGEFSGLSGSGTGSAASVSGLSSVALPAAAAAFIGGNILKSLGRKSAERKALAHTVAPLRTALPQSVTTSRGMQTLFAFTDPRTGSRLFASPLARDQVLAGKSARAIAGVWNPRLQVFGAWNGSTGFSSNADLAKSNASNQVGKEPH